jgi:small subunit ribosomal protein S16
MAVAIKLFRFGKKNQPFYRIVVANKRGKRGGRYIEELGYYNPIKNPHEIKINQERLNYWLSQGAQPSEGINKLLKLKRG